jgi:hypothetical protein
MAKAILHTEAHSDTPQKPAGPCRSVYIHTSDLIDFIDRLGNLSDFRGSKEALLATAKECDVTFNQLVRSRAAAKATIPKEYADQVADLYYRIGHAAALVRSVVENTEHNCAAVFGLVGVLENLEEVSREVWLELDRFEAVDPAGQNGNSSPGDGKS